MRRTALLGLILAASPASAAAPYAEDAAAIAAFFASSVPLAGAAVAVHEVAGPVSAATTATLSLRAELFRLGIAVARPEAAADYDLRGVIFDEPSRKLWQAELWRRSDGRLAAFSGRTLGGTRLWTESPSAESGEGRKRWAISGGALVQQHAVGFVAGGRWAFARTWEAGIDVERFLSGRSITYRTGVLNVTVNYRLTTWRTKAFAHRSFQSSEHRFLKRWLPRGSSLQAGTGVAVLFVNELAEFHGFGVVRTDVTSNTSHVQPLLSSGFHTPLTDRLAFELGADWMPDVGAGGSQNVGGFTGSARLRF